MPATHASGDDRLHGDLAAHVRASFDAFLGRAEDPAADPASRFHRHPRAGDPPGGAGGLADGPPAAFRIGQLTLWQTVLDAVGSNHVARAAVPISGGA